MKEKKARIKDAQASVKAALQEGVLPGGGVALLRAAHDLTPSNWKGDVALGAQILKQALGAPFHQIVKNAGGNGAVTAAKVMQERKRSFGYNADTGVFVDLIEDGVIDPCKVTTTALSNAVSVASVLISTNCLISDIKEQGNGEMEDED
jgi:chaperonin GroEL